VLISLDATSMECDDTDLDAEEAKNIFRRGCKYHMYVCGVEQLKGINRNTDKGRCASRLGEEVDKQLLLFL
jgi:hypothetical protein